MIYSYIASGEHWDTSKHNYENHKKSLRLAFKGKLLHVIESNRKYLAQL
jgi:hypothetical protein